MAVGDIYRISCDCSTNNRAWSFGFYIKEVTDVETGDGLTVAEACDWNFTAKVRELLSTDSRLESWHAAKRYLGHNPAGRKYITTGTGLSTGDALSNDNCLYIGLRQTYTDAAHNGGFYVSGQSQSVQAASKWDDTYLTDKVKPFTDVLSDNFSAQYPYTGTWRLVIISKTMMPWLEPLGTVMNVTGAAANNRVMTQSRRRQKVKGFS